MKVLVTGGYGLLGTSLQKVLEINKSKWSDYQFVFLSRKMCDLRNKQHVLEYFKKQNPQIVIHLASHVGGMYDNMNNNYKYLMDNILINCNVVDACKEVGVGKLINVLSTCIFPDEAVVYPLTSDQLHNGLPHFSNIGYAYSKRVLQVASKILSDTTDISVVNLIPTNLYGEFDNYNIESGHVIPALIHKMYLAQKNKKHFYVKGSGSAVRQFLYVDDLSRAILRFMTTELIQKEVSCIVSPPAENEVSIKNLVNLIQRVFEFDGEIVYSSQDHQDGQHKKTTTENELLSYFPDFTFTSLEAGLRKTISFFERNYESIRR
jgi:GDP-L-fucose synthase